MNGRRRRDLDGTHKSSDQGQIGARAARARTPRCLSASSTAARGRGDDQRRPSKEDLAELANPAAIAPPVKPPIHPSERPASTPRAPQSIEIVTHRRSGALLLARLYARDAEAHPPSAAAQAPVPPARAGLDVARTPARARRAPLSETSPPTPHRCKCPIILPALRFRRAAVHRLLGALHLPGGNVRKRHPALAERSASLPRGEEQNLCLGPD